MSEIGWFGWLLRLAGVITFVVLAVYFLAAVASGLTGETWLLVGAGVVAAAGFLILSRGAR